MKSFLRNYRFGLAGALAALATLPVTSTADARDYVLLLIDRSGSMTIPSAGTPGGTRWETAKQLAISDLGVAAADRKYAIWTFDGTTHVEHVPFSDDLSREQAQDFIRSSPGLGAPGSTTPLAGAICDAVDHMLLDLPLAADDQLFLNLYSDGLENATVMHPCEGPSSPDHLNPTDPDTWEYKVFNKLFNGDPDIPGRVAPRVVANAAVLFDHEIAIFADKQNQNPSKSPLIESLLREGAPIPPDVSAFPSRAVSQLGQFFRFIADKTGGRYRAFAPTSRLPQVGDVNGDYCVNKKDLSLVTASLGSSVDRYSPLDPNQNGVVDIYDEETVKKHMGQCKQ